jgi:hypothetical protein
MERAILSAKNEGTVPIASLSSILVIRKPIGLAEANIPFLPEFHYGPYIGNKPIPDAGML